jgi:ribonucleotide reductase beta subunit family protein with ferritin-like domain
MTDPAKVVLSASNELHRDPDGISDAARKFCLCLPPRHPAPWAFYKRQVELFWTPEEVDLTKDRAHWRDGLNDDERHFVKMVLAYFASSDGIVCSNLGRFVEETDHLKEVSFAYGFQAAMENIHSEMYSLLIDTYITDHDEKRHLFNAIIEVPCVKRKAEWALSWSSSERTLAERIVAFACVEGIHFSSSFCAIFWLKKRGLMPGLCFSNELISRDEGLHTDLACCVLRLLCERGEAEMPPQEVAERIVGQAVEIEAEYCREGLPVDLLGMNADLMIEYVEFVADRLLAQLGYRRMFGRERCVFDWMEDIGLSQKTNFFEGRVSEYVRAAAGRSAEDNSFDVSIDLDADV